jgi:hypothetical protein
LRLGPRAPALAIEISIPSALSEARREEWRREWDSNPRGLSACRFSRPVHSTALPSLQTSGESNRAERDAHAEKCVDGVGLYLQVDGLRHAAAVGIFTD